MVDAPRKLSTISASPNYDPEMCKLVDTVFVNNVAIPLCRAYDMDQGWAAGKTPDGQWLPKAYGEVTVVMKG